MNISSLSIQNKKRLSELLEDLTDILKRKDSLMENASKEIDRMNTIIDMQNKLDIKGSEFTSIATPIDAKELQELVEKSDKLSSEKEELNLKSRQLNNDLEELSKIENSLMEEINKILSSSNINEEKEEGIFVESINSNVFIIDAKIPEDKDLISQENCEIINCNINLIAEIAKLYNSNINKIIMETENNDFVELQEKVEKYKENKNNSYDKQLEILKKSFEDNNIDKEEKPIIQEEVNNSINEQTIDTEVINEPIVTESESIVNNEPSVVLKEEKNEDSIVPLSSLLDQQLNVPEAKEEIKLDNTSINDNTIYIDSNDKVIPNQIARATKDKLYNKIINIFSGSYPETKIQSLASVNDTTPFNLENFVNNKTA